MKSAELADHLCRVFLDRRLDDMPETVPPLSGERTKDDMIWIAANILKKVRAK